jgi:hypothetical protein
MVDGYHSEQLDGFVMIRSMFSFEDNIDDENHCERILYSIWDGISEKIIIHTSSFFLGKRYP